ncbi:MAG: general secretion pathway protein GspB [Gammaproteobacteria bacterium]
MSYILDALRRAERERAGAGAETEARSATEDRHPRLRPATLALSGATLFLAGIGITLLLLEPERPRAPAATPTTAAARPAQVAAAPVVPPIEPQTALPQRDEPDPLPEPATLGDYESLDDITPVFQGTPVVAPSPTPSPPQAVETRPAVASATAAPQPVARAAPGTPTAVQLAPLLRDMPEAYRARFPALQLQVHVHDADPQKRWVMIDGQRYREGAVLGSGPRIVEIVAEGLILEYQHQQVLLPLAR